MNVLVVNVGLGVGGGELSLISFINNFNFQKHNLSLGLLKPELDLINRINPNVKIIKLYEKTQLCDYDIAIGYKQGKSTSFVANKVKAKKKIAIFRHGSIKYTGIRKFIYGNQYKKIDNIVTLNEDMKIKLSKHFNINLDKISVINDFFDKEEIIIKSNEYKVNKENEILILSVSRIVPIKKLDLIPFIAQKLNKKNINFKWYILGDYKDKKYYNKIINLVEKFELKEKVLFMGNVENPMPYYKACDIYAQISEIDCLPRSVIEALIMKVPVLSTDTVGGKTLIKSNYNGQLCKINDIEDISDKLLYMVEHLSYLKENQPEYKVDNLEIMEGYYKLFV